MKSRGVFISLDGIDGTGKSTQCKLLADWLRDRGHSVTECADPGGTQIGQQIRDILLQSRHDMSVACEMYLFMASRAQLVQEVIRPALEKGHVVISDRFLLANVVYQGHAGGLDADQLWSIGKLATGGLAPDLTIVLDMPVDQARLRRTTEADRMERRDREYYEQVRAGFLLEAKKNAEKISVVDAGKSVEYVQEKLRDIFARHVNCLPAFSSKTPSD